MFDAPPTAVDQATVMDRVSDWLGSFVPGCAQLPSRHPVRVSLVMGPLGIAAGAMIFAFWSGFGRETLAYNGNPYWGLPTDAMLVSSAVSGVLILVPLLLWDRNSWFLCLVSIPIAMLSRYAGESAHWLWPFQFTEDWERYGSSGLDDLIVALIHALWIAVVIRRRAGWILSLSILSGLVCGPAWLWFFDRTWGSWPTPNAVLHILGEVAFAAPWLAFYAALAISLGVSIWDATPLPDSHDVD